MSGFNEPDMNFGMTLSTRGTEKYYAIVAGDSSQAHGFVRAKGMRPGRCRIVTSPRVLDGYRPDAVMFVGSWAERRDIVEIEALVARIGAKAGKKFKVTFHR